MPSNTQSLKIIAIGGQEDSCPLLILSELIYQNGCQINYIGHQLLDEYATVAVVTAPWNQISKLKSQFEKMCEAAKWRHDITTFETPDDSDINQIDHVDIPYTIHVKSALDNHVLDPLCSLIKGLELNMKDATVTTRYIAQSGQKINEYHLSVNIPTSYSIGNIRESFSIFCDEMNIDGFLEPSL